MTVGVSTAGQVFDRPEWGAEGREETHSRRNHMQSTTRLMSASWRASGMWTRRRWVGRIVMVVSDDMAR